MIELYISTLCRARIKCIVIENFSSCVNKCSTSIKKIKWSQKKDL